MLLLSMLILIASVSTAQPGDDNEPTDKDDAADQPMDDATRKGLEAYNRGFDLAKNEQWGDALASFEESARHRDAPLVQYNIAICQRALGRYVAARGTAKKVLAAPGSLSQSYVEDLQAYVAEFEAVVVRLEVTVAPKTAGLTVDGRPLEKSGDVYVTGKGKAPAEGSKLGIERFTVLLDPGSHLFLARRKGHQDVVIQRSYRPGQQTKLALKLDEMPATVVVKSSPKDAIIRVNDREVGVAPAEFERPPGNYRLEVFKDEYETYTTQLDLEAGQRAELTAELQPYVAPVYERWWFWTSLVGVVATGVVTAVVVTLPEPVPPDYETGSADWLVTPEPSGLTVASF